MLLLRREALRRLEPLLLDHLLKFLRHLLMILVDPLRELLDLLILRLLLRRLGKLHFEHVPFGRVNQEQLVRVIRLLKFRRNLARLSALPTLAARLRAPGLRAGLSRLRAAGLRLAALVLPR